MNGKINIVFGFFYLAMTAVLGPALIVPIYPDKFAAQHEMTEAVKAVETGDSTKIGPALSSITKYIGVGDRMGQISGGPHAHGNLEALLNIAAGLTLLMLTINARFKSLLSILFLVGAIGHSGMLYVATVFNIPAALNLTVIGAIAILSALILTGIAAVMGLPSEPEPD